jgi:hypothetical protein
MTRGLRGCYVFCTDPALAAYLRERIPRPSAPTPYAPAPEQLSLAAEGPLDS